MSEAESQHGGGHDEGTHAASGPHVVWLDALRAIAALAVMGCHLIVIGGLDVPVSSVWGWLNFGFLGVDVFFALSGAVMVLSTRRLIDVAESGWRTAFIRRRLARIVPLYFASSLAFLLLVEPFRLQQDDALWNLASHALFVHNLFPNLHGALNGPSWSLGVEMQFYALLLFIAPLALRTSPIRLLVAAAAVSLGWRVATFAYIDPQTDPDAATTGFFLATQLPGVLLSFAGGAAVARMIDPARRPGRGSIAVVGLLLLAAWAGVGLALLHLQAGYWTALSGLLGAWLLVCLACSTSIWIALYLPAPPPRLARLIRGGGNISYGIYLWHTGVILLLLRAPELSKPALALLCVTLTLALSWASWRLLERPCLRWARRGAPGPVPLRRAGA